MEYVPGKTLDQLIGRKGCALNEVLKYAVADCRCTGAGALGRHHSPGLEAIERHCQQNGNVKFLDFGLAKLTEPPALIWRNSNDDERRTIPAPRKVSIVWHCSLHVTGASGRKKVDARSDIFSFGSMLYESVSGRRAFQGESNSLRCPPS